MFQILIELDISFGTIGFGSFGLEDTSEIFKSIGD